MMGGASRLGKKDKYKESPWDQKKEALRMPKGLKKKEKVRGRVCGIPEKQKKKLKRKKESRAEQAEGGDKNQNGLHNHRTR